MAENKKKKARHRSIQKHVFRISFTGGLILGMVSLFIGLGIYAYVLAGQYISIGFNLSRTTTYVIEEMVDMQPLIDSVLSIYHSIPEEERSDPLDPDYLAHFAPITEREDYQVLLEILREYRDINGVEDLCVEAYDYDTMTGVYIADPEEDPELAYPPGAWVAEKMDVIDKFQSWNGEDILYEFWSSEEHGWACSSGMPTRDADGKIIYAVLTDISLKGVIAGMGTFAIWYIIALAAIITIYILLTLRTMKKTLVRPIDRVAEAARQYAADKLADVEKDDHFTDLGVDNCDEIESLARTMDGMEKDMVTYVENLMRVTKEKERIGAELSVAATIQTDMLPTDFPAFPDRTEFDLHASMDPAKEVGGDFYDFFLIDEDHLCLIIADVSDKGVPAALFMMSVKNLLNYRARSGGTPAEILTDVNLHLCSNHKSKQFVTVWLGILEISSGRMICANAGHENPFIRGRDGVFREYRDKHGFVLGGLARAKYTDYELTLEAGDAIFVYTDGVAEANNPAAEFYGAERLAAALNESARQTPQNILENVRKDVDSFAAGVKQFDDLTMLCVELKKGKQE